MSLAVIDARVFFSPIETTPGSFTYIDIVMCVCVWAEVGPLGHAPSNYLSTNSNETILFGQNSEIGAVGGLRPNPKRRWT